MTTVLIPVTVFTYAPALSQVPVFLVNGGCTAVSGGYGALSEKWTFALANLIFDTLACILGSIPLIGIVRNSSGRLSSILLTDGIGYFVVAVIVQAFNLSFLLSPDKSKQGTILTLQSVVTSILAQRIITSLTERTICDEFSQYDTHSICFSSAVHGSRVVRPPLAMDSFRPNTESQADGSESLHSDRIKVEVTTPTARTGSCDRDDEEIHMRMISPCRTREERTRRRYASGRASHGISGEKDAVEERREECGGQGGGEVRVGGNGTRARPWEDETRIDPA
ncbi:hypothetical protein FB451DRAFT_1379000 [Mycena latifolia]|nr:hypothetical protein FB451DRAFT_1379000 [Mycena latifolia]